ncbi:AMP-dependent synthetase/ligase [Penicillium bovifimosum]|uniref:AMP-dependent synthetase/ligase n=1 Tax=Penicillium bovifimosum TaxID=126998 RepID=A0A9W9GU73_9EURO|nr:AMP-dependent synthetase/ligase [Penicillium bovifimosum]KAJ5129324.1 AMP-dependent synthetase/ligase [Penicillium bovifimosum]
MTLPAIKERAQLKTLKFLPESSEPGIVPSSPLQGPMLLETIREGKADFNPFELDFEPSVSLDLVPVCI